MECVISGTIRMKTEYIENGEITELGYQAFIMCLPPNTPPVSRFWFVQDKDYISAETGHADFRFYGVT